MKKMRQAKTHLMINFGNIYFLELSTSINYYIDYIMENKD